MEIATFKAKCKNTECRHDFDAPLLSDFSYGEFLYGTIDGKEVRYYCSLDCEIWDFIDQTVSRYFGKKNREEIGVMIQKTVGFVADRQNTEIYFTQDIYCPQCCSKVRSIDTDDKTGRGNYAHLTFEEFRQLGEWEKEKLIDTCLRKI